VWLRKNNLLPPDFNHAEFDEEQIRKEYDDANKDITKEMFDDEDDWVSFDVCIINKANGGLVLPCVSRSGHIKIQNVQSIQSQAYQICNENLVFKTPTY
jgi:hypothetical protein